METPEDFGFPFEPYEIQERFMKELYQVLSKEQLGIFESREWIELKVVLVITDNRKCNSSHWNGKIFKHDLRLIDLAEGLWEA